MKVRVFAAVILVGFYTLSDVFADGDPTRGAQLYRACVACHALEPGLHLSGPSLGNIMGRQAGTAEGFVRYSPGMKAAQFSWNAAVLDAWLKDSGAMIPDTYMVLPEITDPGVRADLVAFLGIAGKPGGGEKAVDDGLIPAEYLRAGAPEPIHDIPPEIRVSAIRHCGDSYFIATEDGRETPYWEKNIRLKIDSVESGPPQGVAMILGAGMRGDRFSVIFSSLDDLQSLVEENCSE